MTRNHHIETPITSAEAFEDALATLVGSAIENDVNVRGAWEFETRDSTLEWDVNISELDRTSDGSA